MLGRVNIKENAGKSTRRCATFSCRESLLATVETIETEELVLIILTQETVKIVETVENV